MNNRDLKLIYIALGSLMLVMLQTNAFQNAIGLVNVIGPLYMIGPLYIGDLLFLLAGILSFMGAIIFIFIALKLIFNNIKNK